MQLTFFDIGVVIILLLFAVRGGMRGLISEVAGLLGLITGLLLARTFFLEASEYLTRYIAPDAAPAIAFIALFFGGMLLVGVLARILQRILDVAFAKGLDALFGFMAGMIKGAAFCAVLAYGAMMLVPHIEAVKSAMTIPYFMDGIRYVAEAIHINIPMP